MTKKTTRKKTNTTTETLELDDLKASQVKGGSAVPLLYQALTKNETFASSPRDPATNLVVKK